MYSEEMKASIRKVEHSRQHRLWQSPKRMNPMEKEELLETWHPDHRKGEHIVMPCGASKGQRVPVKLGRLLLSKSPVADWSLDGCDFDYDTDVLVIGGGGAGAVAAIEAARRGARVLLATKLKFGYSNTMMAEGGIQGADGERDSPWMHFLDSYGGGHFEGDKKLLRTLTGGGPEAIRYLVSLGVEFDRKEDGSFMLRHGGGTSRKRMHAVRDATGLEIMRVLREEVLNTPQIELLEYNAAVELLTSDASEGTNEAGSQNAAGAMFLHMETGRQTVVRSRAVVIATGGSGRLHYQDFPTSNHYGAMGEGLVIGYRAGVPLVHPCSVQFHPTGAAYPPQITGALISEKVRSLGARLCNASGEDFLHPMETRDVTAAAIIRETEENGVHEDGQKGVWLDTPMIDMIHGEGTIEDNLPLLYRMYQGCGIDIRKEPILVYPTQHYQNGGLKIDEEARCRGYRNLFAAGEVTGGVHGTNRLMGNALLELVVFGRIAGGNAAEEARKEYELRPGLSHVRDYMKELRDCFIDTGKVSPALLPDYTRDVRLPGFDYNGFVI